MNSKGMLKLGLMVVVLVAFTVSFPSAAAAQGKCETLLGTITAQYQIDPCCGWVGQAYLSFGTDPAVWFATLKVVSTGDKAHPTLKPDYSGNFAGYESWTFTIEGVGILYMSGHFVGIAGATPYAYQVSETGKITGGTHAFDGATGSFSDHGPFVLGGGMGGPGPTADMPFVTISEMHGSICGLR